MCVTTRLYIYEVEKKLYTRTEKQTHVCTNKKGTNNTQRIKEHTYTKVDVSKHKLYAHKVRKKNYQVKYTQTEKKKKGGQKLD